MQLVRLVLERSMMAVCIISPRCACARVTVVVSCVCVCVCVSVCLSVCVSVTALAASACVHSSHKQYTWVSRRLFLDFDLWIFEKC